MTRKGLALGVGAVLVASTFGVAPANANGLADKSFVSLTPRVGTEYTVLMDQYFDLSANVADTLAGTSGRDLKFLVSDPQSRVFVDQSQTDSVTSYSAAGSTLASIGVSSTTATLTVSGTAVAAGEKLFVYGMTGQSGTDFNGKVFTRTADTTATLTVTAGTANATVTGAVAEKTNGLNTRAAILANGSLGDADLFESATIQDQAGKTMTAGRASDGTFVVDTNTNANANNRLLRLVANTTSTYSVTVTAWVDSNNDGLINDTEYTSPARTVTFVKAGDVTAVTTLSPIVGDENLVANITTTPVLNGNQVLAQDGDFLNAAFTRSLSTSTVYSAVDLASTTQSSAWNDTTKTWTVTASLDADAAGERNTADGSVVTDSWAGIAAPTASGITAVSVSTTGLVTVTDAAHGLRTGDRVTVVIDAADTSVAIAGESVARTVTATGPDTFTYQVSETTGFPTSTATDSSVGGSTAWTLATYTGPQGLADRVGAETYSAQAVIQTGASTWTAISTKVETGVTSAATSSAEVSTKASTAVQGKVYDDQSGTNAAQVLTGTKTVEVTFTALDADGDALGAGRPIAVTLTRSGTVDTARVNGKTADTVLTGANGTATVTITAVNGAKDMDLRVQGVVENRATVYIDLQWRDASFGLVDLATTAASLNTSETRAMVELGSYTMNLAVMDQWYNAPAAGAYRLKLTGEGVAAQFVALNNGRANVTVTDTGVFGTQVATVIDLEKMSGTTVTGTTTYTITADLAKTYRVVLGANGTTLYGTEADLSDAVAKKALLELDKRVQAGETPAYANDVLINGQVANNATSAGRQGALVTITGPSNILFSNGEKAARGSLTFLSGSNGNFEVKLYSTAAQTDTVITVTSNGASSTTKVTFTGIGVGEGTKLDVTAPANVRPASTFQVKAKLSDAFGNGVEATAGRVKVTYTGPGIVFGTLPDKTDKNGELMFSVLLGSNDTGNVVVTVSYDQNGDADYVDAKDLNTTKTITVGTGAAAGAGKVNVGSFNGKLVVYAAGLNGARISWKVGGNWGSAVASSNYSIFNRPTPRAGVTVSVDIYVNGVSTLTKSVVTR
ncbi:unannotated protein [freshwater metagenome]|uniref:Unannotated protein n=1 Tax=freshwater metagenome TaxID=449393 RepID=A0A6J6BUJ2_9ZZZZ